MSWELGFVAVSALLGEPPEAVVVAVGGADGSGAVRWHEALRSLSREDRAREIARAVAPLAAAIEKATLA